MRRAIRAEAAELEAGAPDAVAQGAPRTEPTPA
jgi:hypothetical protein